jgi:hypothetical protein
VRWSQCGNVRVRRVPDCVDGVCVRYVPQRPLQNRHVLGEWVRDFLHHQQLWHRQGVQRWELCEYQPMRKQSLCEGHVCGPEREVQVRLPRGVDWRHVFQRRQRLRTQPVQKRRELSQWRSWHGRVHLHLCCRLFGFYLCHQHQRLLAKPVRQQWHVL